MRVVGFVTQALVIRKVLGHVGRREGPRKDRSPWSCRFRAIWGYVFEQERREIQPPQFQFCIFSSPEARRIAAPNNARAGPFDGRYGGACGDSYLPLYQRHSAGTGPVAR